jgi:aryl carrier-like protein
VDITATLHESELRAAIGPLLGIAPEAIEPDANLVVLGLSSLEIMRLVSTWRRKKIPVEFEQLIATPTLAGWLAHLAAMKATVR